MGKNRKGKVAIAAVLAVLLVLMAALAGCGPSSTSDGGDAQNSAGTGASGQSDTKDGTETGTSGQPDPQNTSGAQQPDISEAEAKAAVLQHAGLSEADAEWYRSEIDRDGGRLVYEIEFRAGDFEYEYEVDAGSGSILKYEKDREYPAK